MAGIQISKHLNQKPTYQDLLTKHHKSTKESQNITRIVPCKNNTSNTPGNKDKICSMYKVNTSYATIVGGLSSKVQY